MPPPAEGSRALDFAFVGCGRAARFHAEVVRGLGHRVVAASARKASPNLEAFGHTYEAPATYDDWRRMLALEHPDAIVVATPWDVTQELVAEVVQTGIPCLVEKPVALDVATLATIIDQVGHSSSRVRVGYNRRFYESVAPVREALRRWPLLSIDMLLPEATIVLRDSYSPDIARHMLVYMSSHWFDLLRSLVGDVTVLDVYEKRKPDLGYATAYHGLLWSTRFGVPIHLRSNFDAPDQMSISFDFEDRIYRLSPIETLTVSHGLRREKSTGGRVHRYQPVVEWVAHADEAYKPGFYRQMAEFVATCVHSSETPGDGATLEDARAVTRLIEDIQMRSHRY